MAKKQKEAPISPAVKALFMPPSPFDINRAPADITDAKAAPSLDYGIYESEKVKEERRWRGDANRPTHREGDYETHKKEAFDALIPKLQKEGLSVQAIANIMGNIKAESSFDYGTNENMRYSAKSLQDDKRFENISPEKMAKISGDPYEVAMIKYGTRDTSEWKSDNPYKGVAYRGRGFIQTTSPGNYKGLSDYLNKQGIKVDLLKNPELINQDPEIAAEAAIYHLKRNAPGGRLSAYEDINKTFSAIKFDGWDTAKGETNRQNRIKFAEQLKPEIETYLNPPKADKKSTLKKKKE